MSRHSEPVDYGLILRTLLAVAVLTLYAILSASPVLGGLGGDNAYYLLMAQHYSPWSEATPVSAYFAAQSQYPPLFPAFLALFGGAESLLVAHWLTAALMLAALLVCRSFLLLEGMGRWMTVLTVVAIALVPGMYLQSLHVHSESLYLLLSLLALFAARKAETGHHRGAVWGVALLVAAASLTRSAGVSLVVAFLVWLWIQPGAGSVTARYSWPQRLLLSAAALVPMLGWGLLRDGSGKTGYLQSLLEAYHDNVFEALGIIITGQFDALVWGWNANLLLGEQGVTVSLALGGLGLFAALIRALQRRLDGLYVLAYLALMLLWPYPAESTRFMQVICPLLLMQSVLLLASLPPLRVVARDWRPWPVAVLLALYSLNLPALGFVTGRYLQPLPAAMAGYRHHPKWYLGDAETARIRVTSIYLLTLAIQRDVQTLPVDACVYSIKPSIVGYLGQRPSLGLPREPVTAEAMMVAMRASGCEYFYALAMASPSYSQWLYPLGKLQGHYQVLAVSRAGNDGYVVGVLGRLRPETKLPPGLVEDDGDGVRQVQ